MSSPYSDLDRPPLRVASLRRALVRPGSPWSALDVVTETGSTNDDLLRHAATGAPHGSVLVAESQTAGRGRLGRRWVSPPRSGLAVSLLLRPGIPGAADPADPAGAADPADPAGAADPADAAGAADPADAAGTGVPARHWGWLPLLAGAAARAALADLTELDVALKWPNDLVIGADEPPGSRAGSEESAGYGYGYGGRKLGGILAQRFDGGVVVGIGVNVSTRRAELPTPQATSLALEGAAVTDREPLLRELLRQVGGWYARWERAHGDAAACGLRDEYTAHCATVGRAVRVSLPDGGTIEGTATAIDEHGALVLAAGAVHRGGAGGVPAGALPEATTITAGDVVHVR